MIIRLQIRTWWRQCPLTPPLYRDGSLSVFRTAVAPYGAITRPPPLPTLRCSNQCCHNLSIGWTSFSLAFSIVRRRSLCVASASYLCACAASWTYLWVERRALRTGYIEPAVSATADRDARERDRDDHCDVVVVVRSEYPSATHLGCSRIGLAQRPAGYTWSIIFSIIYYNINV